MIKEAYDKISTEFSVTRIFTWSWTDKFINNLDKGSIILDLGCGNGRNMNYDSMITYGIDNSFYQLKQSKINTKIVQANMCNIPFKDNIFDAILSIASFHHLQTYNERIDCLREMSRLLKPTGKILISVWSFNQPNKTKRKFKNYGDNIVNWNSKKYGNIPRYYYIFRISEIQNLFNIFFNIVNHYWDCGNEIFELSKKNN